jgi:hypothetical protein
MQSYESLLNGDLNWALMEGSMHFEGTSAVHRTLKRLAHRLDELNVDYAIAGDMALFFHGYRRFTEHVDVLVTPDGLQTIHESFEGLGYVRSFEKSKNLRDAETGVKINLLVTGEYPGNGKPGPIAFPDPATSREVIEAVNVLELPRLIELKLASGISATYRMRDLDDVQRLIQVLGLPYSFGGQLDSGMQDWFEAIWHGAQDAIREEELWEQQ